MGAVPDAVGDADRTVWVADCFRLPLTDFPTCTDLSISSDLS